jgi:hypothetical protein
MKAVIDTSSLVSLVRYFLPFDKEGKLKVFLAENILSRKIIVLEQVAEECKRQGKGQVIEAFPFIAKPKYKTSIAGIQVNKAIYNLVDNNFINASVRKRFPEAEYQLVRNQFIVSADFAMMLYAYSIKDKENVVIVTEETGFSNDGKPFKKIPDICSIIGVKTQNFPGFLLENRIIDMKIEVEKTSLF